MKHYIIAKFKDRSDLDRLYPEISELFAGVTELEGVDGLEIHKSNSTRENRYSLMIILHLSQKGLDSFDASGIHKDWKARYGERLESKAIFDCD